MRDRRSARRFVAAVAACVPLVLFVALAHAGEAPLPVPPIPPAAPAFADAPVPDPDARDPVSTTPRTSVSLDTTVNHRASPSMGAGFSPGARYNLDDTRRALTAPGILLRVPVP